MIILVHHLIVVYLFCCPGNEIVEKNNNLVGKFRGLVGKNNNLVLNIESSSWKNIYFSIVL